MDQPVGPGQDLDKSAEVHDLLDRPEVNLAFLGFGHEPVDEGFGFLDGRAVGGGDVDRAVVFHVDFHLEVLLDLLDGGAALADDVPDLVDRHLDGDDPRGVGGKVLVGARPGSCP